MRKEIGTNLCAISDIRGLVAWYHGHIATCLGLIVVIFAVAK